MARNAVARSAFLYANAIKSRLSVSIPSQLQKEFRPSLPAFISLNQQQHEVLPSKSLQTSLIRYYRTHQAASATSKENATPNTAHFGSTIADAAAGVAPAVAKLYAQRGLGAEEVIGSGTIINKDGYILTCAHVVFDERYAINSADCEVVVHLQEARKDVVGRVVDAYMDLDIAIIKIDPPSSLSSAKVGSSSKLRPRDPVIAMGSGIISCVHGMVNDLDEGGMHKEYIQTNCAINPGHSGGPLCNVDGEVVGVRVETVNVGKPSGVSFAIPVDFISKIIKPFQNCRTLVRPDFGWVVRNVTKENCKALKKYYPTSPKAGEGVFVEKVIVGSPADRAGIEAGYVVVDFNGQQVRNIKEMMKVMVEERSGAPVKVIVKRVGCGKDEFIRRTITFEENDAPALSP